MGSEPPIAWETSALDSAVEDVEAARAEEYAFIARLFAKAPEQDFLDRIALIPDDGSPMGRVHGDLSRAATAHGRGGGGARAFQPFRRRRSR